MADKIYRMILKESDGTPETGLLVRARSLATEATYTMSEVPGASGAGKYITAELLPNGAYLLEKSTNGGTTWGPINPSDPDLNIVTVEPGTFRQANNTLQSDTQRVLRGEVHALSFVPVGTSPSSVHINQALAYAATLNAGHSRVVLGVDSQLGTGTWGVISTINIPDNVTLDLAGCQMVNVTGIGSNPLFVMNSGSVLCNGVIWDSRTTGPVISITAYSYGSRIEARIEAAGVRDFSNPIIGVPDYTAAPVVVGVSNGFPLDPATDNPYGDTGLSSNPMAVSKWPIALSNNNVAAAKVRPGDLQAFFYRAMSSEANKGDDFAAGLDDNTLNNGEKLGRALRMLARGIIIPASNIEFATGGNGGNFVSATTVNASGYVRLSGLPGACRIDIRLASTVGFVSDGSNGNPANPWATIRLPAGAIPTGYGSNFVGSVRGNPRSTAAGAGVGGYGADITDGRTLRVYTLSTGSLGFTELTGTLTP